MPWDSGKAGAPAAVAEWPCLVPALPVATWPGFYGLDVYSLLESLESIINYLTKQVLVMPTHTTSASHSHPHHTTSNVSLPSCHMREHDAACVTTGP